MGSGKTLHVLSLPVMPKFVASDTESAPSASQGSEDQIQV